MTEVVEGFAIETLEGMIFTVKGLVHPPDRWIAYLRYRPHPEGTRTRGNTFYQRLYRFEEQMDILRYQFPAYLGYDPVFGMEVQGVPRHRVRHVYDPTQQLARIRRQGPADAKEKVVLDLAELLTKEAAIPPESLGISGSVLYGLHRPESDLDMVVYGDSESRAVHGALRRLLASRTGPVRRLSVAELHELHSSHVMDTPLTFENFAWHQSRKANEGCFSKTSYFMRFVPRKKEEKEHYGHYCYEPVRPAVICFRVSHDGERIFTPCSYGVNQVTFLDGRPEADLRDVISFRGRFSDQLREGEWATARGMVERVEPRGGDVYYRLVVGGRSGDFLFRGNRP